VAARAQHPAAGSAAPVAHVRRDIDADTRARIDRAVGRLVPGWLSPHRDDLVQMCVVKLLKTRSTAELSDAFLSRVAYSVIVDEIRRRRRRNEVGMSPSLPDRLAGSNDISPETRSHGAALGEQLVECLQLLVEARRRAVVLYLQDHTIPEIAELLGWDTKKASNSVYRGLEDLRAALAARGLTRADAR
jgi:RNA polymerase sigma-70 factor (ECF subfamily)